MNFSAAIAFPFRGSHAWPNIGYLLLCFLIPIVGPIVTIGFLIHVEKTLIENLNADAPPFSFGKFSRYLQRGLQPFLASLIMTLVVMALMIPLSFLLVFCIIYFRQQPVWIAVSIAAFIVAYFLLMMLLGFLGGPLIFKAGLEESFKAAFDGAYLKGYLRRVGWLMLKTQLVMMLFTLPLMILAFVPVVGAGAVMAVIVSISAHLNTQLYLIYLQRGGTPLAIKPEPVELSAFPVLPLSPTPAS